MNPTEPTVDAVPHIVSEHMLLYVFIPVILLWGIIDCFYGFRFFKLTVICVGSLVLGYAGSQLAQNYFTPGTYTYLGGFVAGMAVGIVFSWILYRLETFLLGMALGMFVATSFFSQVSELQLGVTCLGGLAGGILMLMFMDLMIISATAITGALRIVLCIACYTGAVAIADIYRLVEGDSALAVWYRWNLDIRYVIAMLILMLLGYMKQYSAHKKNSES